MKRDLENITGFFRQVQSDKRLRPVHLSLCMALCTCWQSGNYQMPFRVTRKGLMELARIGSTATYHKCIKELLGFGYIDYRSDYNYYKGSQVSLTLIKV
ncbi:hypothetical protein [Mucilaginibacter sp. NFX135]|uniref:hypothetical protein n=1 Tax=Mucilaginibacter sp. NFX135 TaxID=3402687 RepID=UPI003AFA48EF